MKVKSLKSYIGGEDISKKSVEYCAKHEMKMIKTVPGTPQQNDIAWRMIITFNGKARNTMLNTRSYMIDVVNTVAYLINSAPLVALDFKIPGEE